MVRILPFVLVLVMALGMKVQAQELPDKITYCGIELTLTKGAKQKLSGYISAIYQSPPYFNAMVDMAGTYMPFVEEAFRKERTPDDLKYLIIQESSIKADVVSSSNAVGFWQFKHDPALEYGLEVNNKVDERMHIYQASSAAARYLKNGNNDFDNWVYSVIAFYEGLTGAVAYTDPQYYGEKKMVVTENLHWYVMKAIAHKLAYEEALNLDRDPRVWLEPFSTEGRTQVEALYEGHGIGPELFFEYNKWIRDPSRLPRGEAFTYYIPRFSSSSTYSGHISDPIHNAEAAVAAAGTTPAPEIELPNEESEWQENVPSVTTQSEASSEEVPVFVPVSGGSGAAMVAMDPANQSEFDYAEFSLDNDLNYGVDFVLYQQKTKISDFSDRYDVRLSQLLEWNGLIPGELLPDGKVLYLQKPSKATFHVVEKDESLEDIALFHESSVSKIQKKNRMDKNNRVIFVGQKLYLKKKKPKEEKIIVLKKASQSGSPESESDLSDAQQGLTENVAQPTNSGGLMATPANLPPVFEIKNETESEKASGPKAPKMVAGDDHDDPQTRWVVHTVVEGETLWSISVAYGTKVEIIKLTNKLQVDNIKEGMVLRILAKEDKLKAMQSQE